FQRTTRSYSLSPAGHALLEPAKHMLASHQAAVEAVHRSSSGQAGHVTLGYAHPSSRDLAAALVTGAHERKPGRVFQLDPTVYADEGLERIMDGSLDLALVRWHQRPQLIDGRPVAVERPCVAMPSSHRLSGRKSVNVEELVD